MKKPNLFIVGAAKSGTTTLYKYLKGHSKVFMPKDELYKEPAFFSTKSKNTCISDYLDIFKDAGDEHIYIGEASTAYLTDKQSAQKIFDFNPDSKIIIMLRNPIDRAYSLYNWMVQEGYEYAKSFKIALRLEQRRKNKKIPNFWEPEYYYNYLYLESGLYYEQVKRYVELFPSQNVKIIIFEEMVRDINNTYIEVCKFLNIDYEKVMVKNENESKKVIFPPLCFFIRKVITQMSKFTIFHTKEERDKLLKLCQLNRKPNKLSNNLRKNMILYFKKDIKNLSNLLNRDLSAIWKDFR